MTKEEEIAAIAAVVAGDPNAFRAIVAHYQSAVFSITYRICKSKEQAEELAQDVFLKVYHSLKGFRKDARLSTWIYRIAYNAAVSTTRKKELLWTALEEDKDAGEDQAFFGDEESIDAKRHEMLAPAMEQLSSGEQLLIQLHYNQGMGMSEMAEILDLSVSNVKVKLFRTRKRLHEIIENGIKNEQSE